ncbi:MAG TPA: RNA-binding protein [Candidatus Saccharimonadales bacterium]|nr:RNA-binding protein [Candidatus Saccharimonadales bacterium]
MSAKIYVGSLAYSVDDAKLKAMFDEFGTVDSAKVIVDRDSNQSKGFGFVEMSSEDEAQAAIKALDGKEVEGRALVVNVAKPQVDRSRSSFGGGRRY